MSKDNDVTNKDLLKVLMQMKDNHLSHIQTSTGITVWILGAIFITILISVIKPFIGG